jgi:hypothetical protein
MNAPLRSQDFIAVTVKAESTYWPLRGLLRVLFTIFSSPKGDQGGWEGGARGL